MYNLCGSPDEAEKVFRQSRAEGANKVHVWNAMLNCYGNYGRGKEALTRFDEMKRQHAVTPDDVTYVHMLNACSHSGLVEEGLRVYEEMKVVMMVTPKITHQGCLVDLLGRAGRLDEAEKAIADSPFPPDDRMWRSLISACRTHGDLDRAQRAAEKAIALSSHDPTTYLMLCNFLGAKGRFQEMEDLGREMKRKGIDKQSGQSWLEVDGVVHAFVAATR